MLPAFQRPLSGLLSTTASCFLEFPDKCNPTDGRNSKFPDQRCNPEDERNSEDLERPGGIFCDCCGGQSDHQSSPATKSWDKLETVDFFIDDGAEVIAGCCPQADTQSRLQKDNVLDGSCDKDSDNDAVLNDLLFTCGDLIETLV